MSDTHSPRHVRDRVDVLVVEDNPGDARLLREAFEAAETNVETELYAVESETDAMAFLNRTDGYESVPAPDLVLLDLHLSGRDGCDVLETIRADSRFRRLPVIMLTSSTATEDVARCYSAQANAYLRKPMDPDALVSTVEVLERFWLEEARLPPTPR